MTGRDAIDLRQPLAFAPRELLLTFDDGPHPNVTPRVLASLAAQNVRAVFFMIGNMATANPAVARQVHAAGHLVASHTATHPKLAELPLADGTREIAEGHRLVTAALAPATPSPLFRFPYLSLNADLEAAVRAQGLTALSAAIIPRDWEEQTADHLADFALSEIARIDSGIIVLHDIHDRTALALPRILETAIARGYRFLTPVVR